MKTTKTTQSEFIKKYCQLSNKAEETLNKLGEFSIYCECDAEDCEGWRMVNIKYIKCENIIQKTNET